MNIDTNWKIESDALNVILLKKVKRTRKADKTEYEAWEIAGHYATPAGALKGLAEMKLKETGLSDLRKIVAKQEEIYKLIDSLASLPIGGSNGAKIRRD